jgi:hypothetical protein
MLVEQVVVDPTDRPVIVDQIAASPGCSSIRPSWPDQLDQSVAVRRSHRRDQLTWSPANALARTARPIA